MNRHSPSLALDQHSTDFIEQQVEEGKFGSPSEVLQAGLKLLEEQKAQIDRLRTALIEGEESGEPRPFDFDEFFARKRSQHSK